MKKSNILDGLVSLIPQQAARFIVYSLLTILVVNFSRLLGKEI